MSTITRTTNPLLPSSTDSLNTIQGEPHDAALSVSSDGSIATMPEPYMNKTKKNRYSFNKPGKLAKQLYNSAKDMTKYSDDASIVFNKGLDKLRKLKNYVPGLSRTRAAKEAARKREKYTNALDMKIKSDTRDCKKYINKVKTDLDGLGSRLFTLPDTSQEDVPFDPEKPELNGDISSILFIKEEYQIHQDNTNNISEDDLEKDRLVTAEDKAYAEKFGIKQPYYYKISVNPLFTNLDLEEIKATFSAPTGFEDIPEEDNTEENDATMADTSSTASEGSNLLASAPQSGYGAIGGGSNEDAFFANKIVPFIQNLHELAINSDPDVPENEHINAEVMAKKLTQWNRLITLKKVFVNMENNPLKMASAGKRKTRRKNKTKKRGRK